VPGPGEGEDVNDKDPTGLPIAVGNRLATEVGNKVETEETKDLGNPNKLALLNFCGPHSENDPVYFLAFPSGHDRRGLSECKRTPEISCKDVQRLSPFDRHLTFPED
jgi:hypothetical protein